MRGFLGRVRNDPTRPKPPSLQKRRLLFRSVLPTEGLELAKHDSCGSVHQVPRLRIFRLINTFIEITQL